LRIPLTFGAALAVVAAVGGSAWAEAPASAASGPNDELGYIQVWGATTTGEQLQWVDAAEAAMPDKAVLPEINGADWLPEAQN